MNSSIPVSGAETTTIIAGYDDIDGARPVPNGLRPGELTAHPAGRGKFDLAEILTFTARAGFAVSSARVADVAGSGSRWFYFLRPRGVPDLYPVLSSLQQDVLCDLDAGRCHIVIDYSREGFSDWIFPLVYGPVDALSLPHRQVILLCGDMNTVGAHSAYASRRSGASINVHHVNMFRQSVADALVSSRAPSEPAVSSLRRRPKRFLCLNRRNRLHRVLLVSRLRKDGLLDKGFVSMPLAIEGVTNEERMEWEASHLGPSASIMNEVRCDYPLLASLLPLSVDTEDIGSSLTETYPDWPYAQSWFSVVTETLFFGSPHGQLFLTEKVWKPVMFRHPFVLFGQANSLAALRRMGFATFEPVIDESYDAIVDHEDRFNAAYEEVRKLVALTDSEIAESAMCLEERLLHNYNVLAATNECSDLADLWAVYLDGRRSPALTPATSQEA